MATKGLTIDVDVSDFDELLADLQDLAVHFDQLPEHLRKRFDELMTTRQGFEFGPIKGSKMVCKASPDLLAWLATVRAIRVDRETRMNTDKHG